MAVALSLAACGGPASRQAAPPASAGSPTITISAFAFAPASLRVTPGAQVTVVNRDDVAHTVTSVSGAFDTGDIAGGRSGRFTAPSRPGSYPYRCTIHQFMTGTLVVSSG
jgi:plastocyanin